jgi:hypothetical protein
MKFNLTLDNFEEISTAILSTDDPLANLMAFLYSNYKREDLLVNYFSKLENIDQEEWWIYVYEIYKIDKDVVIDKLGDDMLYKGLYDYLMDSNISFINFVP